MENGIAYRLDQSLFERMMYPSRHGILPFPTSQLNIQRRMHPEIAELMRVTLYPGLKVRQRYKCLTLILHKAGNCPRDGSLTCVSI